jgi:hypothetical protein
MRQNILVSMIAIAFLSSPRLSAQGCCTAGSPSLGGLQSGTDKKGQLKYAMAFEVTSLATTYLGSNKISNRFNQTAIVGNYSIELGWGISNRLSLSAIGNFSRRQREVKFANGSAFVSEGRGIGDMVVFAKYALWQLDLADQRELSIGAGMKIPVGKSRMKEDGVVLSYDLQPGTGSWDPILWVYAFRGFLPRKYSLFGSATLRFPGENSDGYRLGRELSYFAGGSYRFSNPLDFLLQVRGRHTTGDSYLGYERLSTGGTWLFLVPAANLNVTNRLALQLQYQQPLYFNVVGEQLVPDSTFALAMFYSLGI